MKTVSTIVSVIIGLGALIGTFVLLTENDYEASDGTWHENRPKYARVIVGAFYIMSILIITYMGYRLGILIVRACGLDIIYALSFAFFWFACVALDFVEKTGRSHRAKEDKLEEEIKQLKDKLERSEERVGWLRETISEYEHK